MITCSECKIGLPDGMRRCPMCQRFLWLPAWVRLAIPVLLAMLFGSTVGLILVKSGTIQERLVSLQSSPQDAYIAAVQFLRKEPGLRDAVRFGAERDTVVERWGPSRWRVAGYADTPAKPAGKAHMYYSCVMWYRGGDLWEIEDVHFERLE